MFKSCSFYISMSSLNITLLAFSFKICGKFTHVHYALRRVNAFHYFLFTLIWFFAPYIYLSSSLELLLHISISISIWLYDFTLGLILSKSNKTPNLTSLHFNVNCWIFRLNSTLSKMHEIRIAPTKGDASLCNKTSPRKNFNAQSFVQTYWCVERSDH